MQDTKLPRGFRFAGVKCGVRPDRDRLDLALVVSDRPATAAGVFTQNRVCAAPVIVCRERLPTDDARGFVVCAGNANACTGEQGLADAHEMAAAAANQVGCDERQMLVASTGVIGRMLPMPKINSGIEMAAEVLCSTPGAFRDVTQAIMTTDTRSKVVFRSMKAGGGEIRIAGFAKGAAMIGPNLATMLAFVLTDAGTEPVHLQDALVRAADRSFNCVTVEGHTSTNDSLIVMANGASEKQLSGADVEQFDSILAEVCTDLAKMIAGDAEGAKHMVTVEVEGLASDDDARRIAKTVAESALVKTAIYGGDPNWGRFVSAAGYAGVHFEESELSCWLGDIQLYAEGAPLPFDASTASAYLKTNRDVTVRLRFSIGSGRCTFWTCDLTPEYVRLNGEYTT